MGIGEVAVPMTTKALFYWTAWVFLAIAYVGMPGGDGILRAWGPGSFLLAGVLTALVAAAISAWDDRA